eukprot:2872798-Pyramimonas_sp.AAC.1
MPSFRPEGESSRAAAQGPPSKKYALPAGLSRTAHLLESSRVKGRLRRQWRCRKNVPRSLHLGVKVP